MVAHSSYANEPNQIDVDQASIDGVVARKKRGHEKKNKTLASSVEIAAVVRQNRKRPRGGDAGGGEGGREGVPPLVCK